MKKKLENFIFYYKYHIIAAIFVLIIVFLLWRDKSPEKVDFVIVDDTSRMNMTAGDDMMKDFEKQQKIKSGSTAFRYKSMYLSQDRFQEISFEVAEIRDYEMCFTDGTIDMVITTADKLEPAEEETETQFEPTEEEDGTQLEPAEEEENKSELDTDEEPAEQKETAEEENGTAVSYETVLLDEVLSDDEMSRYEKYLYYVNDKAVGIVFNKCKKAEEYFGDNYPTGYHYILQVAAGSAKDEQVKKFIRYLIGE